MRRITTSNYLLVWCQIGSYQLGLEHLTQVEEGMNKRKLVSQRNTKSQISAWRKTHTPFSQHDLKNLLSSYSEILCSYQWHKHLLTLTRHVLHHQSSFFLLLQVALGLRSLSCLGTPIFLLFPGKLPSFFTFLILLPVGSSHQITREEFSISWCLLC